MSTHTDTTRYTIAVVGDMLIAIAPDGDETTLQTGIEDTMSNLNPEDREQALANLETHSGLILFRNEESAREAEDEGRVEIVYSGTTTGWLQDADGNTGYEAAARPVRPV
jgi:hypothetical protein